MANIAYYRVSTDDQTVASQRAMISATIDKEFIDDDVSGSVPAMMRPGFKALVEYVREGDTVHLYALDRLGRDALDIQATVRMLLNKDVRLEVRGIGPVARGVGEIVVAVLAQLAEMEKTRIRERCDAGRVAARQSLLLTGKTQNGRHGLGRPMAADRDAVRSWRTTNSASIAKTAAHFNVSKNTVIRYCADTVSG